MQNKQIIDPSIQGLNNIPQHFDKLAKNYYVYKYASALKVSEPEQQEMNVLEVLEQLGFPMDKTGTYFYKEIIMKTMEELEMVETKEEERDLKTAMENSYSQFYFDIARNNIDIGLKSFHGCIQLAYEGRKKTPDCIKLEQRIGISGVCSDYRAEASLIARHIMTNNNKAKAPQAVQTTAVVKVK